MTSTTIEGVSVHPIAMPRHDRVFRIALATIWLYTAAICFFVYPVEDSLALLRRVSLEGVPAYVALYGGAALDLAFGLATWLVPGRRLWLLQGSLTVVYSLIIVATMPDMLTHPFGPVLKNVAVVAVLYALWREDGRR